MDWLPLLLVPALALLALPFVGSPSTWVTLTVAGLAMGMMIFLMASGLTLVFGLMDIINFGHGVFISLGAYATLLVLGPLAGWAQADSLGLNLALLLLCILCAMTVTGLVGAVFERVIVRPVYGSHLKQILVTMGGLIVTEQAIHAIWGASPIPIPLPHPCAAPSFSATSSWSASASWLSSSGLWSSSACSCCSTAPASAC